MKGSWSVTVERDCETVVTIASDSLSGRDLSHQDEETIRIAARHLLAFVGDPEASEARSADRETLARLRDAQEFVTLVNTIWKKTRDGRRAKELAEERLAFLAGRICATEAPSPQPLTCCPYPTSARLHNDASAFNYYHAPEYATTLAETLQRQLDAVDAAVGFPDGSGRGRIEMIAAHYGSDWQKDGSRALPFDRDELGRMVREAWVRWALMQPSPKPSWLTPYAELSEADKEADRQIGEAVARWTLIGDAAAWPVNAKLSVEAELLAGEMALGATASEAYASILKRLNAALAVARVK